MIFALLGRVIGVDQDHILCKHLASELVLPKYEIDGRFHRHILDKDSRAAVVLHFAVEDKVDAGLTGEYLKNHLGICLTELQRYRTVITGLQARRHRARAAVGVDTGT